MTQPELLDLLGTAFISLGVGGFALALVAVDWPSYLNSKDKISGQFKIGANAGIFGYIRKPWAVTVRVYRWAAALLFVAFLGVLLYGPSA